jgi:hypothetical protein
MNMGRSVGIVVLVLACFHTSQQCYGEPVRIGTESRVEDNARSHYNRYVNWRPADGETVSLNPPRISWPYWPDFPNNWNAELHTFRLQISSSADMSQPIVDVRCDYNFYNTLPALDQARVWYWRVGYDVDTDHEVWSPVRSFRIAEDAQVWDRAALAGPNFAERGHPRVLFNKENLETIRQLAQTDPGSRAALDYMRSTADSILQKPWWDDFPKTDTELTPKQTFYSIAEDLVTVCFVWRMTGDDKYAGVKEHALTLATYPPGGRSSPEGLAPPEALWNKGKANEDATQTDEFLALLFDWLYPDLDDQERKIMIHSLEWRADHVMNGFAWKMGGRVYSESLSACARSHQFEASMVNSVCGLVLYEHSDIGRKWFDLMLNYIIGVTSAHGFDGAWNEGAGYGASKLKWLTHASIYFDTAIPDAKLGSNPIYSRIGEYFRRIVPVGMPHHAWGNQRNSMRKNHLRHCRKLAYFTGDGKFLYNWQQYGGKTFSTFRPWIEYVLPAYYKKPEPQPETDFVGFFPIDGWGMAATGPPSSADTYRQGLGLAFQCRPRAAFSHSFYSDNSCILHAYGRMLNHGGSSCTNDDEFADHTMSHSAVLIDGLGQVQPDRDLGQAFPTYGRIVGHSRVDDYVYLAGDATRCYPQEPIDTGTSEALSTWGHIPEVYTQKALPYLKRYVRHILFLRQKYFVVFDDLACSRPATFTWLYHILPDQPLDFDPEHFAVDYNVGDVKVRLQQIAHTDNLQFDDRKGLDGHVNPITGEDYREYHEGDILCGHNLWISNKEKAGEWQFLTVIYPEPPGGRIPVIKALDDSSVQVGDDLICFDPNSEYASEADFLVDIAAFRTSY